MNGDEHGGDNLYESTNLARSIPDANATALDPCWYSQLHTLAHVAADHEAVINCNLLIPNGTADHTELVVAKHFRSIRIEVGMIQDECLQQFKSRNLGFNQNVV